GVPRNRVRHRLLPALAADDDRTDRSDPTGRSDLAARLARLAGRARGAGAALDRRLAGLLAAEPEMGGVAIARAAWEGLPPELCPFALAWLHRRAGAPYPAGAAARAELLRQLGGPGRTACDCGGGWRWEARGGLLVLCRGPEARKPVPDFT